MTLLELDSILRKHGFHILLSSTRTINSIPLGLQVVFSDILIEIGDKEFAKYLNKDGDYIGNETQDTDNLNSTFVLIRDYLIDKLNYYLGIYWECTILLDLSAFLNRDEKIYYKYIVDISLRNKKTATVFRIYFNDVQDKTPVEYNLPSITRKELLLCVD